MTIVILDLKSLAKIAGIDPGTLKEWIIPANIRFADSSALSQTDLALDIAG